MKSKQIWGLAAAAAAVAADAAMASGVAAELAELGVADAEEEEGRKTPPVLGPDPPAKAPSPAERGLPSW